MPENGLVVYTGTILTEDGKEKKVNIDFEPFKPINTSLYLCDNKFHTQVTHPHFPHCDCTSSSIDPAPAPAYTNTRHTSGCVTSESVKTELLALVVTASASLLCTQHRILCIHV